MSWGDGSGVPTSGKSLVIASVDTNGVLHIRIFDDGGNRITDTDETKLPDTKAVAISALKYRISGLLPPHVLTTAESAQLVTDVRSIVVQKHKEYVVWCQVADAPWGESGVGAPSEVLHQLDAMDEAKRVTAAHRFLGLPNAARRWQEDFVKATGFVALRDGKTPKARSCELHRVEDGYDLRWDANIWDMIGEIWVPDRESASFSRIVRGVDLVLLRDCATVRAHIPVTTA